MDRRYWLVAGVVASLLVVGGAALVADRPAGPDPPDESADDVYVQVERVTDPVPDSETVAYESLTPEQQDLFESALADGGLVPVPDGADSSAWYDIDYVRYRNETYEVLVAVP